ncbi:type IA DNA topoisomerase [Pseudomonas syringae pv. theae]|uniref:type IA DNA topoisomerase n=1 Tax=Pseudomonas syringae TaxID=317 RepID=UPI00235B49D7|nr:type IA DNA topoisomerase [Pseudomonas syringae]MBL3870675.1 type IA DNA topoisomerase [Pseudomonas syringae pv. theae]GKQ32349.1 type IA DNA topoisomerase [Pseudomonas syringae pv. theae]
MRVFIAEKPALGQVIAEALGTVIRKDGYFECGSNDIVTWCVGHLLELAPPEVHNPDYKNWVQADLPLKLRPARYQPIARTRDQLKVVQQLIGRASEIVHAGDPDDEGQLLVDEVLVHFGNTAPVKRILINDMNANAARKALEGLRDNGEFYGLFQKALARSIGDQLYGFNMTRACTLAGRAKGVKGVLSVGRVQTPILGLIVNRYLANKSHTSAFYYTVAGSLAFGSSRPQARLVVAADAPIDDKNRIIDEAYATQVADACRMKPADVIEARVEEKQTSAPLPFALLNLQVYMSKTHSIDAEKTLALTQALREKYKAITYNRSDCSYLTDEQFGEAPQTLSLLNEALPDLAGMFSEVNSERKSRAFNDSKVSAHTAIIPTAVKIDIAQLSDDELAVYLAIVKRYVAQFLPEKRYLSAKVCFGVNGHTFVARSTKVTHPGWAAQVAEETEEEEDRQEDGDPLVFDALADLKVGDAGVCDGITVAKEKTKPLPLYTEAELLKDLRRVAKYVQDPRIKQLLIARDQGKEGENGGIGTPATRGAVLAKLQERGFYAVEKKKLIPTPLGLEFIAALPAIATAPDMTALWHEQQQMIEAGELTVDAFLDELEAFIADQVKNIDLGNVQGDGKPVLDSLNAQCPMCGSELAVTPRVIGCRACAFKFHPEVSGKMLSPGQIEALLTKGKTGVLKGFHSKKTGKSFEAALKLNHEAKLEFVFSRKPTRA